MFAKQTQMDHVIEDQGYQPEEIVRTVAPPGVENLHEKSTQEIANVIATVLRTEPNVVKLEWEVGKPFKLTTKPDRLRL